MGTDKLALRVDGRTVVDRVVDAAVAAECGPVVVCVAAHATTGLTPRTDVRVLPDAVSDAGPLHAIAAALSGPLGPQLHADSWALVVAGDLARPDPTALRSLLSTAADRPGIDAVVPVVTGAAGRPRRQLLTAAYGPRALAALVAAAAGGERALHRALASVPLRVWEPAWSGPLASATTDVDTPGDALALFGARVPGGTAAPAASGTSLTHMHHSDHGSTSGAARGEIDVARLAELLGSGAALVDVREPDEFAEVHVPQARLVPLATLPASLDAVRADGPVYVICRSGARSARAVAFLCEQGIDAVNVAGGTLAWIEAGLPCEHGSAASGA